MAKFTLKMPDVGEGVAEAELVEWHVKPGDAVREDMVLAAVMTDKATVEIPSPVSGIVTWIGANIGDTIAVKAPLLRIETNIELAGVETSAEAVPAPEEEVKQQETESSQGAGDETPSKPLASPAVRHHAKEEGIDLQDIRGSGPSGRVTHEDIEAHKGGASVAPQTGNHVEEITITGLRRRIADKMSLSASSIPHFTYVEEVDVTDLEDLRQTMNGERAPERPKLTVLPFLMRALVRAIAQQPDMNATYDEQRGVILRHRSIHIGIATQTKAGLMVPVVRDAASHDIWRCASEVSRLSEAAREGRTNREELSGSTITITSLGALGGVVSTPVINHPEVAILGINKIMTRPVWDGNSFMPRKMMNISSSFDHRVIDGFDAANFIQRIKRLLETPALIFIDG